MIGIQSLVLSRRYQASDTESRTSCSSDQMTIMCICLCSFWYQFAGTICHNSGWACRAKGRENRLACLRIALQLGIFGSLHRDFTFSGSLLAGQLFATNTPVAQLCYSTESILMWRGGAKLANAAWSYFPTQNGQGLLVTQRWQLSETEEWARWKCFWWFCFAVTNYGLVKY